MSKVVIMGRPGVLYPKPKREEDFDEYKFYKDVPENLTILGNMEFAIAIVGNSRNDESGASYRGAFDRVTEGIYHYSPSLVIISTCYHGSDGCECRLPKPKMIKQVFDEYEFDIDESFMIAGYPSDFTAANDAGIKNIIILTTGYKKWNDAMESEAIAKVPSFSKAIGIIHEYMSIALSL